MKTLKFDNKDEWLLARRGKITGSKDVSPKTRGQGKRIGFYELIAERLALPSEDESALEHGVNCEPEAVKKFEEVTGKKVDTSLVIWERDDNESIAVSPDGFVGKTVAVEAKCLSSARHIEAWLTQKIPDEYEFQKLQYFIVNEKLQTLYFVFYDPRIPAKDFFYIEVKRKDIQEQIDQYLTYQRLVLEEVEVIVNDLTF